MNRPGVRSDPALNSVRIGRFPEMGQLTLCSGAFFVVSARIQTLHADRPPEGLVLVSCYIGYWRIAAFFLFEANHALLKKAAIPDRVNNFVDMTAFEPVVPDFAH